MIVAVAITDTASIDNHHMVQQGPIPFFDRRKAIEEIRQQRDVMTVDLADLGLFLRVVAVVGKCVMAVSDP